MRRNSYSSVEVLFVIVVIAVLAAVAIPRLSVPFTVKMRVKTAAQKLISDLRLTRRLAITNNENYRLSIDSSNKEYAIYDSVNSQQGLTKVIDSAITVSADKDFIFEHLGNASALSDISVSFSAQGNQADISVVIATGRISVAGP